MTAGLLPFLLIVLLVLGGCVGDALSTSRLGEAYVGPATLQLKKELTTKSPVSGVVTHGEKLDIIGRRRRFMLVRNSKGVEGWTDGNLLITQREMDALDRLAKSHEKTPAMGDATSFDALNIHTLPNRMAPSFAQIKPGAKVAVIGHELIEREPYIPPTLIEPPKPVPRKKKPKAKPKVELPPSGKPPELPRNYQEISQFPPAPPEAPANEDGTGSLSKPDAPEKPVEKPVMDDWSLIRLRDGRAGWVYTRLLVMAIPDEVAQYAERQRITSYFKISEIDDDGVKKPFWLWTTIRGGGLPYDFDSVRFFIWNRKRDRYETSYIERGLVGYYPVEIKFMPNDQFPQFWLIVQTPEGTFERREYTFNGWRADITNRIPTNSPEPIWPIEEEETSKAPPPPAPGTKDRVIGWLRSLRGR